MDEDRNKKCKKRLCFENYLQEEIVLGHGSDKTRQVPDLIDVEEYNCTKYWFNKFSLAVSLPIHQQCQAKETESVISTEEPPLIRSGLNSLMSTPKSISLSDVNFIASPSAVFLSKSPLPNISSVDEFFENLENQIEKEKQTPTQDKHNVICVEAQISAPKAKSKQLPNIIKNSYLTSHQTPLFKDKKITYADYISPEKQVTIEFSAVEQERQSSIIIFEVVDDNQNTVSYLSQLNREESHAEVEAISDEPNVQASLQISQDDAESDVLAENSPQVVLLSNDTSDTGSDWQMLPLEKPDSPVKLTRKRKRNEENWKDNKNKKLKNCGKSYVSVRTNKTREEKSMGATCSCKRECYEKISTAVRKKIFNQYWRTGEHEKQWEWILRHVTSNSIKKMQLERNCNRTQTIFYKLPSNEEMTSEEIVCKKMFLQTLGISDRVVYTAIEKRNSSVTDLRGKHENRPRKISVDTESSVVEHIEKFPAIESHYTRKRSAKVYLSEDLNISKMYRFYKSWFASTSKYKDCTMASKHQYDMIFNSKFNISFFKPKKDQCDTCSIYKNADEKRKLELNEEYDDHLKEKEEVRKVKDFEKCATDSNVKTIACFDLEKVLYIPQSEVSAFYYKRKFAIYNFTVYDLMKKKGYCYLWNQQTAKRGAIEVGSCLWHYINQEKNRGKNELSLYSDACTGQNRNRFIFAMYQYACKKLNISITHRFFVSGHSQSEGDMMHSCVERAKKHQTIYTPEQMYFLVENAKVEGEKFEVKEMAQQDFYDVKKLVSQRGANWTQDNDGQKVYWSKIREISIKAEEDNTIYFKYGLHKTQKCIKTNKVMTNSRRKRNNNANASSVEVNLLEVAYSKPIPVPRPLHKDLMSLCTSGAIRERYQGFYRNLTVQDQPNAQAEIDDSDEED